MTDHNATYNIIYSLIHDKLNHSMSLLLRNLHFNSLQQVRLTFTKISLFISWTLTKVFRRRNKWKIFLPMLLILSWNYFESKLRKKYIFFLFWFTYLYLPLVPFFSSKKWKFHWVFIWSFSHYHILSFFFIDYVNGWKYSPFQLSLAA